MVNTIENIIHHLHVFQFVQHQHLHVFQLVHHHHDALICSTITADVDAPFLAEFPASWGNVISPEQCCTMCAHANTGGIAVATFGIFNYNFAGVDVLPTEEQYCRCYAAGSTHIVGPPVGYG